MRACALFSSLLVVTSLFVHPPKLLADRADKRFRSATEAFRKGDLGKAEGELEAVLAVKPAYAEASALLAAARLLLGQQSEQQVDSSRAISGLREALRLDPNQAYWHFALAVLLNQQGDTDESARECAFAARLSPDEWSVPPGCWLKGGYVSDKGSVVAGASLQDKSVTPAISEYHPLPPYPPEARFMGLQGKMVLVILVNAEGAVEKARVVQALGSILDQSALRTVLTWKFRPAMKNGQPIPVRVEVEFTYRLNAR